jgi:Spy/CpxP family protein refolding chaperone
MKKVFLVPLIIILFSAVPFFASAIPPDGQNVTQEGPGDSVGILGPEGIFRFVVELKLTDEQLNKLHSIKDSGKREVFKSHNEMMLTVWDIQDEIKKDNPDKAKLYAFSDKIAEEQKKIARLRIDQMLSVKAVLTPEQFSKLISLIDAKRNKMKSRILEKVIGDK